MIPRVATLAVLAMPLLAATSDPLAGRVAGKPESCIELSRMSGPAIYDGGMIVYRQSGRRIWVTHAVDSCPALRPFSQLIVEPTGAQLCHNDRFRTFEPGDIIPSAYCRFARFTPYDKPGAVRSRR